MRKYVIGFISSLIITFCAFGSVEFGWFDGTMLLLILGLLAVIQAVVQLNYFLHLGDELKPRVRLMTFSFMLAILIIIVGGSLWIMHHLNYNMMQMSPQEKDYYMSGQKDKGF